MTERYYSLGELIDALELVKQDAKILIASPYRLYPVGFCSYRGFYEDLAIQFGGNDIGYKGLKYEDQPTVGSFLAELKLQVGNGYGGWKGGWFGMDRDSRLWIAQSGESSGCRVTGIDEDAGTIYITYAMRYLRGNGGRSR